MTLLEVKEGMEYTIENIATDDDELTAFLFTLGCYSGEPITVVSKKRGNSVISIKDARYSIDNLLAGVIEVSGDL